MTELVNGAVIVVTPPVAPPQVVVPVPGPAGTGGGGGNVTSVFGRTGVVVATTGDYTAAQVGADAAGAAAAAQAASQPLDPDLTTIAAIDSSQTGVLATDGAGWIRKAYSAVKTALGLTKSDVGLGNVDNTSDVNKPVSTATQTALNLKADLASPALTGTPTAPTAAASTNTTQLATTAFVQTAVTNAVAGLYDLRGTYDASGNTFPASGGSGSAGAVLKGDVWVVSVGGTLGGTAVVAGDQVLALVDAPGQTASNWSLYEHDLGYTPENVANKSTDGTLASNSTTLYPSQSAVKTYADTKVPQTRTVTAGTGLSGGGDLTADRTISLPNTGTAGTYGDASHTLTVTTDAQGRVTAVTTNAISDGSVSSLTRQAKTANYTAVLWDLVACDTTSAGFTVTLPAASGGKGRIVVKLVAGTNTLSLALTGSDHFNTSTGPTTGSLTIVNQSVTLESDGTSLWTVTSDDLPLTTLDSRYFVGGFGPVFPISTRMTSTPGPWSGDGTTQPANGELRLARYPLAISTAYNKVTINIGTGGSTGALLRLGLYADTNGLPIGAPLYDWGTVAATASGDTSITTSFTLPIGHYWLGIVTQGAPTTTPIIRAYNTSFNAAGTNDPAGAYGGNGTQPRLAAQAQSTPVVTGVTGALPTLSAGSFTWSSGAQVPQIWLTAV